MACAALATEPPTPQLLEEKPHGRDEALISPAMWKHIFCQAFYQLFWLFLIVYGSTKYIAPYRVSSLLTDTICARLQNMSASLGRPHINVSLQSAGSLRNRFSGILHEWGHATHDMHRAAGCCFSGGGSL